MLACLCVECRHRVGMGTWPAYNAREIEFRLLKVAGTEEEVVSDMSTHLDHLEAAHVRHRTLSPQLALVEIVQERLPGWSARRCVVKVVTAEQLLEPVIDHPYRRTGSRC